MSGWDSWATNVMQAGSTGGAAGAALYDPASGALWGKAGSFECSGCLNAYDSKAAGKDANVPTVNGATYMFIRRTQGDEEVCIFKKGADSLLTTKGPSGSRVVVYVKEHKPEQVVGSIIAYLKPHV